MDELAGHRRYPHAEVSTRGQVGSRGGEFRWLVRVGLCCGPNEEAVPIERIFTGR